MGFATYDALLSAMTVNGQNLRIDFNRVIQTSATTAASRWHELLSLNGTGGAMVLTGTPGTGIVMNRSTVGALPLNADVTPATRHLTSMWAVTTSALAVPGVILLTDIIHIYPSLVLVTTPSTLSNHPTWTGTGDTRMTSAAGVMMSFVLTTASTAAGRIDPNYKDQGGADQAAGLSFWGPVAATPIGCFMSAATATATPSGLYMALAAGDTGVQRINSYAITTGVTTGVGCFILHRPIATIPLIAANVVAERDFTSGAPLLPRIHDDSCLGMFALVGGALTTATGIVTGGLTYAWA